MCDWKKLRGPFVAVILACTTLVPQAQTSLAPLKLGDLTVTGSWRVRLESWNWFDTPAADSRYNFLGSLLRLGIGQKRPTWDWQVEGAMPLLLGLPANAIAPPPQGQLGMGASYYASNGGRNASVFLKQGFLRFKHIGGDEASSLRFGRSEFIDGTETLPKDPSLAVLKRERIAHRLIGNFGFSHVGRSLDGVQFVRDTPTANLTLLAGRATNGVFQLNGMGEMGVDIYYGAFTKPLHLRAEGKGILAQGEGRLFALHYHDGRGALKTDNRPTAVRAADTNNIRITTLGGHYLRILNVGFGQGDVLLWGAWQTGQWGRQDHNAGAVAAEAGFQPPYDRLKPWFRAGYFRSTGDNNPADDRHQTFFQVLPTPRVYARFPFYNLMNDEDLFTQLSLSPHANWTVRADLHALRLSNEHDLWYSGGGAYQKSIFGYVGRPSGGSKGLATLYDLSIDYRISQRTTLTFYLARAQGKTVLSAIYPDGKNANFGYVEVTQRF